MADSLPELFSCHLDRSDGVIPFDKAAFPAHGGVYAFEDEQGQLVQLAAGEQLRRLIGFRLYPLQDEKKRVRADILAITHRVWWEPSFSQFETSLKFHEIAYQLYPKRYRKMCAFGPAWFAVVNVEDRFPHWVASLNPFDGRSACVGPFQTRSLCERLVHQMEDLLSLCRYHHILEQTPEGAACAYFEMGRCPAPCDGTIPFEQYLRMLRDSVNMVLQGGREFSQRLADRMKTAAGEMQFEQANRLKQDMIGAEKVTDMLRRLHKRRDDFRYLIIQRAGGRTKVKAFFVNQGEIMISAPVLLKKLADVVPRWLDQLKDMAEPGISNLTLAKERIWLVCHFLNKRDKIPGLFVHHLDVSDAETLTHQVRQAFAPKRKAGHS